MRNEKIPKNPQMRQLESNKIKMKRLEKTGSKHK